MQLNTRFQIKYLSINIFFTIFVYSFMKSGLISCIFYFYAVPYAFVILIKLLVHGIYNVCMYYVCMYVCMYVCLLHISNTKFHLQEDGRKVCSNTPF
jgi:hypothetical protein